VEDPRITGRGPRKSEHGGIQGNCKAEQELHQQDRADWLGLADWLGVGRVIIDLLGPIQFSMVILAGVHEDGQGRLGGIVGAEIQARAQAAKHWLGRI
jgi:hypothetical protein